VNVPARERAAALTLRRQLGIETPEHVAVHVELAGLGSRSTAALVDTLVASLGVALLLLVPALLLGVAQSGERLATWVLALIVLLGAFAFLGYFVLLEGLNGGRTLGKQLLGIRVVMDTGQPVTATAVVIRNLFRLLDCYFPLLPAIPGLAFVFLQARHQRLGDLVAGTIVVRDRALEWGLSPRATPPDALLEHGPPSLSDDEFRLLDRFLARGASLDPAARGRLAAELERRFQDRLPRRTGNLDADLVELHAVEDGRRRSRFATRSVGVGRTAITAERFVASKQEAWAAFHTLARRIERSGLRALSPGEIPGFAARYRGVAADLARARTYGVDPGVIDYLERVVSAGHNALYRARGRTPTPVLRLLIRDFPAAVVLSRRFVLAAALLLGGPALIGYTMIRAQPSLGTELMPLMVSRAEQAAENQARGVGYAQGRERDLPLIASAIISNNIAVSFWTFVGGLLAGTLTVWLLVMNGLTLGMGFGLFANYHAAGYLGTFVAGHGVLELTAICIAAGAGLRVAGALIAPGDRTRRDALIVEGRIAARMIGAVVTLLAIAGSIEGLLSASDAPAAYKYAASGASVLLLVLYFSNGTLAANVSPSGAGPA
jgi:uncharacterized membrane protein SpoIIM required for sporulation/uncharacterized RDD family membrane protein YckC